jgi:serine/threonine-protein kinase
VHRDIKPGNVMLTPTGAVKVMDFGIARALADAGQTMTQTQAVVGTAQYLSPEQARGESVDARSDLYSTGCLLFELLTGRPPFIGDSPVSVAYQHVREAPPRPSQYASDVPAELDQIVLRALAKDRNERYSSAGEFLADLRAFSSGDPVDPSTGSIAVGAAALGAAGLGAAGLAAAGAAEADRAAIAEQATQAMPAVATTGATEVMPVQQSPWATVAPATIPPTAEVIAQPLDPSLDDEEDEARKRRRRQYWLLGGAALAALLIVLALFLFTRNDGSPDDTTGSVTVPNIVGLTQDQATQALTALGLNPVFESEPSNDVAVDLVTRTEPPVGDSIDSGSDITVFLSTGPSSLVMPDVRGQDQDTAIKTLTDAGLVVQRVDTVNDAELEKDIAAGTDPAAGEPVASGSSVVLQIASGNVDLPDVTGATEDDARSTLGDLGLQVQTKRVETSKYADGTVYKQSPKAGEVPIGSTVTITVASTPTTAAVPDVTGQTQADATNALINAGFKVTVKSQSSTEQPSGLVFAQSPDAGISLGLGQPVTIFVSTGPGPTPDPTESS